MLNEQDITDTLYNIDNAVKRKQPISMWQDGWIYTLEDGIVTKERENKHESKEDKSREVSS